MPLNRHGRSWDDLDALKAHAIYHHAFVLVSEDGEVLCGRQVDGEKAVLLVAKGWSCH